MKLFLYILISFIVISKACSQNIIEIKVEVGTKRKITKIDVDAIDTVLGSSIKKRFSNYDFSKKRPPKGTYLVKVAYVIANDGSIADVKSLSNCGYGMETEAMRAIQKSQIWKPAKQNGRTVQPYRTSKVIVDSL